MKKNTIIILLIFILPLCFYWFLSSRTEILASSDNQKNYEATVLKFSSPLCYECQKLERTIINISPKYFDKIDLKEIDVTKKNKETANLLKEYNVTLVPTTIFKDKNQKIVRRLEGAVDENTFTEYLKELTND